MVTSERLAALTRTRRENEKEEIREKAITFVEEKKRGRQENKKASQGKHFKGSLHWGRGKIQ